MSPPSPRAPSESPHSSDYGYLSANQVGRKLRQSIVLKVRPTKFDRQISTFDIAIFLQALRERIGYIFRFARRPGAEIADRRRRPLLPARRERPSRRAAEQRDELAASHVWMTPAWQEITSRAAQKSLAVMCPACSRSPDGPLALMEFANRGLITRAGSMSQ